MMKKLFLSMTILFFTLTSSQTLNDFFTSHLSMDPCAGYGRLWMSCEMPDGDAEITPYDERYLDEEIFRIVKDHDGSVRCRYTYFFEGNWCEVNGSFTLWFEKGEFIEATDVSRSYWAE